MAITKEQVIAWILDNAQYGQVIFGTPHKGKENVVVGYKPKLDENGVQIELEVEPIIEEHDFEYLGIMMVNRRDITKEKMELQEKLNKLT